MIRCCPYCLSCRINSFGPLLACLATLFIAEIYWVNLPTRIPHPLGFAREVNMTESGQRHARGSSAHLPFAWTRQERLLNFQPQEVSGAGVILNVTTAFLARNWSRYFFANCSEVKCVFMYVCLCTHPHTRAFAPSGSDISRGRALRAFVFAGNFGERSVQKSSDC